MSNGHRKAAAGQGLINYNDAAELEAIEADLINEYLAMAGGMAAQVRQEEEGGEMGLGG